MAIYVYVTTSGQLHSYIPDNITIAQAQANGQLADNATLTANGFSAVDGLAPLDSTHQWDPTTKTVIVVTAPTPPNVLAVYDFIMAFTAAELANIRAASSDNNIQQWLYALECTQGVNLNAGSINTALNYLVTHSFLTQARANAILATIASDSASSMTGR